MEKFPLVNKQVGWYRLVVPLTDTNNSFQTASWWEKTTVAPGVYPVFVRQDNYSKQECFLSIEFTGTVVDDFFPSSFGGVMYGEAKPKHLGESRSVRRRKSLVNGVRESGVYPSDKEDTICIHKEFWQEMSDYHGQQLTKNLASFDRFRKEFETLPENQYLSRVGMVKACAGWVATHAEAQEEIGRKIKSEADVSRSGGYWKKNTEWVPSFPSPEEMRVGLTGKSRLPNGYEAATIEEKSECEAILALYQDTLHIKGGGISSASVPEERKVGIRTALLELVRGETRSIDVLDAHLELKQAVASRCTNPKVIAEFLKDKNEDIRTAATRNSEMLAEINPPSLVGKTPGATPPAGSDKRVGK